MHPGDHLPGKFPRLPHWRSSYIPFRVELYQDAVRLDEGKTYVNLELESHVQITTGDAANHAVGWFVEFTTANGVSVRNKDRMLIAPEKGTQSFTVCIESSRAVTGRLRIVYTAAYGNTNGTMAIHSIRLEDHKRYMVKRELRLHVTESDTPGKVDLRPFFFKDQGTVLLNTGEAVYTQIRGNHAFTVKNHNFEHRFEKDGHVYLGLDTSMSGSEAYILTQNAPYSPDNHDWSYGSPWLPLAMTVGEVFEVETYVTVVDKRSGKVSRGDLTKDYRRLEAVHANWQHPKDEPSTPPDTENADEQVARL